MKRVLAAAVAALALTACGSTVQSRSTVTGAGTEQRLGGSLNVPTQSTETDSQTSPSTTNDPGGTTATSGSTAQQPTTPAGQVPTTTGPVTKPNVPNGTAVTIGIRIPNSSSGKVVGNLTGSTISTGDPRAMASAMIAWVNKHGGLGGHPIVPIFYQNCAPLSCDLATQDQQICAAFTQDKKSVAMVDATETSLALASCLAKHGAASLGGGVAAFDDQDFGVAKGLYSPYLLSTNAAYTQLINRLSATGWFVDGEKIGMLINDTPTFRRTAALVKQQMKAKGRTISDEAYYVAGTGDMSSVVLKFQSQGIKRIVIVDAGSSAMLLFGPAASSQGYYPKVTVTSADVIGTLALIASPKSLDGAAGVGWLPAADAAPNPPAANATQRLCAQIYKQAQVSTSGPLAGAFGAAYCDGFLFAKTAYDKAAGTTLNALRSAIAGLGTGFLPASTFTSRFRASDFAGASTTRDVRYDRSCSCFRYTSGAIAVP